MNATSNSSIHVVQETLPFKLFPFFNDSPYVIYIIAILAYFSVLSLMRERSSGKTSFNKEQLDQNYEGEEFHNDFSKVESGPEIKHLKPQDYTGNVFLHAEEQLEEDLKSAGLDTKKEDS